MRELAAFVGVSALVIVTPGQDTALTIRNTLLGGRAAGMFTALGVAAGQATWTIATAVGVGTLVLHAEAGRTVSRDRVELDEAALVEQPGDPLASGPPGGRVAGRPQPGWTGVERSRPAVLELDHGVMESARFDGIAVAHGLRRRRVALQRGDAGRTTVVASCACAPGSAGQVDTDAIVGLGAFFGIHHGEPSSQLGDSS